MVTYRFYSEDRTFFFYIACFIIAITHICYAICFAIRFTKSTWRCRRILVFISVIPISPLLPFIFYWASFPSNSFSKFLKYIGLDPDEVDANDYRTANANTTEQILNHQQPLLQNNLNVGSVSNSSFDIKEIKKAQRKAKYKRMNAWFQTRILFNCGFLIEGVMQSFPQAILQVIY